MKPFELSGIAEGDQVSNGDRVFHVKHVHRYPEGDAIIVAVSSLIKTTIHYGDDGDVPEGGTLIGYYTGAGFEAQVYGRDDKLGAEDCQFITAVNAKDWEVYR